MDRAAGRLNSWPCTLAHLAGFLHRLLIINIHKSYFKLILVILKKKITKKNKTKLAI